MLATARNRRWVSRIAHRGSELRLSRWVAAVTGRRFAETPTVKELRGNVGRSAGSCAGVKGHGVAPCLCRWREFKFS